MTDTSSWEEAKVTTHTHTHTLPKVFILMPPFDGAHPEAESPSFIYLLWGHSHTILEMYLLGDSRPG